MREEEQRKLLEQAHLAASRFVASLTNKPLSGRSGQTGGSVLTKLSGSSIEFHEHRLYQPGDDVRHLDWRASARLGQPIIKLFREEIHPAIDLVMDLSTSMHLHSAKALRTWELAYVVYELCKEERASFRLLRPGMRDKELPAEALESHDPGLLLADSAPPVLGPEQLGAVAMRRDATKILISDLLFPGDPTPLVSLFRPPALFLVPTSRDESSPPWRGNVSLVDCESGETRKQFVSDELLERYRDAYGRHFELWKTVARKQQIQLLSIASEASLADGLRSLVDYSAGPATGA